MRGQRSAARPIENRRAPLGTNNPLLPFDHPKMLAMLLIRAQIGNIANIFGWSNGSSGLFVPNGARRFSIGLAADL